MLQSLVSVDMEDLPVVVKFLLHSVSSTDVLEVNRTRNKRKPSLCIGENKGADQLCSNCTADQRLCFRHTDSTVAALHCQISPALCLQCRCFRGNNLSRSVRKPSTCIGENKGADQLCSNCTADQRLCFRHTDSTVAALHCQISPALCLQCRCFRGNNLSRSVRKPSTCIGENKGADQLCSNCTADQCLCFRHTDSTVSLLHCQISPALCFQYRCLKVNCKQMEIVMHV